MIKNKEIDGSLKNKEFEDIINEWLDMGLVEEKEVSNMKEADSRKLSDIFKVYLGEENCSKIQKKGAYKLGINTMIGFNELLNAYPEKWNKYIRQGKVKNVPTNIITSVYQRLYEWTMDKECPLSITEVERCYEKMYYRSEISVYQKYKSLQKEIIYYMKLGEENKEDGKNIRINRAIVKELECCRKKIKQFCDVELGAKRPGIFIGYEESQRDDSAE